MTDFYEPQHTPNSPLLQPIKPDIRPRESPPPFASENLSSSSDEEDDPLPDATTAVRSRRRRRVRPSQGDAVLLVQLAPDHPDIAQRAAEETLVPASPSDSGSMSEDMVSVGLPNSTRDVAFSRAQEAVHIHSVVRNEVRRETNDDRPAASEEQAPAGPSSPGRFKTDSPAHLRRLSPKPPRVPPHPIQTDSKFDQTREDDTLASSPNLAKYAITPSEPTVSTLPALQTSPGRTNPMHSPENSQSLPSLKSTLGEQLDGAGLPPLSATSPSMARAVPAPFPHGSGPSLSVYSQTSPSAAKDHQIMSPPSTLSSNPSLWRTAPKSETSMGSSAMSDSTTPSTLSHSPSNTYTSPSSQDQRMSGDSDGTGMMGGPMGANGPFATSAFKCTYPGCTAPPFQTQYLLNSHANVHSQNRPHYCPVKGCPRGLGGKGFKRKNEMIRHGLVHDSPGYVCPFCPDQQHKYPRPDNLQRHVRVHHVDKDKEDPLLREVLAQRPDGPSRGRRRRLGS